MNRRIALALIGATCLPTKAAQTNSALRDWLIGEWKSDRNLTMETFSFQGKLIASKHREQVANLFGKLRYQIDAHRFSVIEASGKLNLKYKVASETDSTITLSFANEKQMPELTLYRVSAEVLFVKAGHNFEYFRKIAA